MLTSEQIKDIQEALELSGGHRVKAAQLLGVTERTIYKYIEQINSMDLDIVTEAVRARKQLQAAQDRNRIANKSFREYSRIENSIEEYTKEIKTLLENHKFSNKPRKHKKSNKLNVGVIHWSDQHLNERVSLPHNKYDWEIASKRLRKHVIEAKGYFKYKNTKDVIVAMTGDLLNSDRRLDELLANAGNRAKASVLAVDLYQQAILELSDDFNVTVAAVCGNESRMTKDVGWEPEVASDSYDFTIHEMLRLLFNKTNVSFIPITNPNEQVINVCGKNLLLIHGHSPSIKKEKQLSVQSIIGRYAARGVRVDMVIWGHLHEASIADNYARSSSLVGANSYSEDSLGLSGRASQNLYLIHSSGGFDGLKVDLQDTAGVNGYSISDRLSVYNTKSSDKCQKSETVFKVVI